MARSRLHLRAPGAQDPGRLLVFLGEDGDHTPYLVSVAPAGEATDGGEARQWRTLREVGLLLDDRDAGLFAAGQALANWHAAHTHCPRCGARTEPDLAGWVRRCTRDATEHYPRTDPAVIMSVTDADDRLLLARGPQWAAGRFSVLAGFVEPGESLEAAVAREVREEVGLVVEEVRYLGNQPWPFPSSLMIGFTARVAGGPLHFADDEVVEALWLSREELAAPRRGRQRRHLTAAVDRATAHRALVRRRDRAARRVDLAGQQVLADRRSPAPLSADRSVGPGRDGGLSRGGS